MMWSTLKFPLIDCQINLKLSWPRIWFNSSAIEGKKIGITDTKFYVPVVTFRLKVTEKCLNN